VHAHEARSVYSGWLGLILFAIPYLLTRRVVNPQKKSGMRGRAYRRATRVVAISRAAANEMRKQHPYLAPDIISDAHADFVIDDASVAKIRARYPGKILIGHVGALVHSHKGQLTIIEAAREAVHSRPEWHFLLVGRGHDEGRFREAMSGLGNIELLGFVNNVGDYLAAFDLFVFPSLHEAVGSTLLDAMRFGLPIVATNVGGIPEIIDDGTNGRLVEAERADQLLAAITAILDDPAELHRMRMANQKKSALFGADRMADAYEEIYRSIV
jgi:glycosyltransferase involved in cell wall biosynthesis